MPLSTDQLANMYHMGHLVRAYRPRQGGMPLTVVGLLLVGIALLAFLLGKAGDSRWMIVLVLLLLMGSGFSALGMLMLAGQRRRNTARLYIYTYGLVYIPTGKPLSMRWSEVHELWIGIRVSRYRSQTRYRLDSYILRREDGQQLTLSCGIWSLSELGSLLEQYIVQEHLPRTLDTYRTGRPVDFGPISVTHQGIALTTIHGQDLLTWDKLTTISVFDEHVIFQVQDHTPYSLSPRTIPNLCVFLALVHTLRSGQGIKADARYDWLLREETGVLA